jgi:enoyl-CoA hydratase/carnithine racemase
VLGGGVALMLNVDMHVSSIMSTFSFGNLSRGMVPGMMLSQTLLSQVGTALSSDLYLADSVASAREALDLRLVHEVRPST